MAPTKSLLMAASALALLTMTGCAAWRVAQSAELARQSEPLQVRPPAPVLRLLVVGDSTAVGTGASTPQASLAGLLAARFPGLMIENRAKDGATFADVARQLAAPAPQGTSFDMVLVNAGGNDVIRLRNLDTVAQDIDRVAQLARQTAPFVVLMPAGNVGNAPFFFPPVSWWMTQRARRLHAAVAASAERHGAVYVRLFEERDNDPFAQQRALNASDGLHPSDAGYRVWLQQLMQQAGLAQRLTAAAPG
ncbi:SGNH/GDSL hydrolase family protein [Roseateles amylovorans]|uniref:GDSL-type esterase/lipase family protein n=1 Tax=Roseateles amylovorans TaxID=2978473 RepID=A0ABY6AS21_9BURK|nr:GDSL-type esterase/lipase family protein [Roseateles amylovorans]UXH76034.1 GDSL-type esterase/lipase family protein [Roseateles amylovorans]